MRAIDSDALCTDLLDRWSVAETRKEELIKAVMADIVTPIIASQPTIEPERKKGKWVGYDGDWLKTMCKCSECGAMIDINEKYRNFFCYHCGARMEDENESDRCGCAD